VTAAQIEAAARLLAGLLAQRRKPGLEWSFLILAAVAALIGAVFLAIAADLALAEHIPAPAAAAVTGGVLVVLALGLSYTALHRHYRTRVSEPTPLPIEALTELATSVIGSVEGAVELSPKSAALAAFAAGCILGCNPGLGRGVRDLFR
jgi:hypothetical protein